MNILPYEKPLIKVSGGIFGMIGIPICSKADWDFLIYAVALKQQKTLSEAVRRLGLQLPEHTPQKLLESILVQYRDAVEEYCESNMDIFNIPENLDFDTMNEEKLKLPILTFGESMVREHTGFDFEKINQLDILDYRMLLADAMKLKMLRRADGKGKEYLNECYNCMHKISNMFD